MWRDRLVSQPHGSWLVRTIDGVREAVYPRRCAGCGFRGVWVCDRCLIETPIFTPLWCERCGTPESVESCRCMLLTESLDAIRSVGPFDGWIRRSIHLIKYEGESDRATCFGDWLSELVQDLGFADCLVSVPLHPARLGERGFDQAEILGKECSRVSGVPMRDFLGRVRNTPHQVGLSGSERRDNVAGAFALQDENSAVPARVILVDDVITTGATLQSCAAALKSAGATWVGAVTLA